MEIVVIHFESEFIQVRAILTGKHDTVSCTVHHDDAVCAWGRISFPRRLTETSQKAMFCMHSFLCSPNML